jgi:hypothetical protein
LLAKFERREVTQKMIEINVKTKPQSRRITARELAGDNQARKRNNRLTQRK